MRKLFLFAVAFVCIAWRAHAVETVLVMRHCVRSTTNHMEGGAPGFNSYDNYTAQPWPPWPDNLAPYLCLPNGLSIVQGTGKWLAAHGGLAHVRGVQDVCVCSCSVFCFLCADACMALVMALVFHVQPIAVTSDNVTRDIETSHALASGLAFPASGIVVNHAPFGNACPGLNSSYRDAAIEGAPLMLRVAARSCCCVSVAVHMWPYVCVCVAVHVCSHCGTHAPSKPSAQPAHRALLHRTRRAPASDWQGGSPVAA